MNNLPFHRDEQEYWNLINQLNWYSLALTNISKDAVELLATKISLMFNSVQDVYAFQNWVVNKRIELQSFLKGYLMGTQNQLLLNDAYALTDLSAHIVGLGRVMYDYVRKNPEFVEILQNDVVENFEYGFERAIDIMTDSTD